MSANDRKPGTLMPKDEFSATAHIRRELIERLTHYKWSKMTVEECDEAVREEALKRTAALEADRGAA